MKSVLFRVLFSLLLLFVVFYHQDSYAEVMEDALGPVSDLLVDNNDIYFFETDVTIQSPTWLPDTRVRYNDGEQTKPLSTELFIFPTELNHVGSFLFFATLSEDCVEQITCDFQNIVKMSKKNGSFEIIHTGLKSAIHLTISNDNLYVSESDGKIWRMSLDGSNKALIYSGDNIIMDMSAHKEYVYWIEEVTDQKNKVMRVNENNFKVETVDDKLVIPYDLKVTFGVPTWNEIQVKPSLGSVNDFTLIKTIHSNKVKTVAEFKNTSPVTGSQSEPHYKPFFVYGNYVIFANNTAGFPLIQLLNYKNDDVIDIGTVEYEIRYFRADSQHLYVVGQNDDGFVIEKMTLPIAIPEFSSIIVILVTSMLSGIILTRRLFPIKLN